MTRVYWDTNLFAYWIEDHPEFGARVGEIRRGMAQRGDRLCASVFTLAELLVLPQRRRNREAAAWIQEMFEAEVEVLPLALDAAPRFAAIRADSRVAAADALHLAIAATAGVSLFLTNDRRLHKLSVPGIAFIAGLDNGLY